MQARIAGRASFTPQPDGTLRWHETGELTLDGSTVATHRTLTIDTAGQVSFDDGRPFHHLALVDGGCDAFHPCAPDEYRAATTSSDDDAFDLTWRVHGPGRDDTIHSRYTRVVQLPSSLTTLAGTPATSVAGGTSRRDDRTGRDDGVGADAHAREGSSPRWRSTRSSRS